MLDDKNVLKQRDPQDALGVLAQQYEQVTYDPSVECGDNDGRPIYHIVIAGMGGSALAAELVKSWLKLDLSLPFEIVRNYELPEYVGTNTLVIASSDSGNTEETLVCLDEALHKRHSQVAITASGGALIETAREHTIAHTIMPAHLQPRMAMLYNLRSLMKLLVHFGVVDQEKYDEIAYASEFLRAETQQWLPDVTVDQNYAKQLALMAVGKTPIFYAGNVMFPVAYKWKISWNENAKNVAFCNQLPEFNHNEFLGWTSHPIEKPYEVFDLVSEEFEHPRVIKRFELSDRLLSGRRPKAQRVTLRGNTMIEQMLWGCILADFASAYTAILNGIDPTQVDLIEKFKKELAN